MGTDSLEWSGMVTSAVAPFLEQAVPSTPSPFDRSPPSRSLQRLFSYATRDVPLADCVEERWTEGDIVIEQVSYATGPLTRASARVVAPSSVARALPGLVVLHCHDAGTRGGLDGGVRGQATER
jgi:hypothetical protein